MKKKYILLIVVLGLCLWGISSITWYEGYYIFYPRNEHERPFAPVYAYFSHNIYVNERHQSLHIKEMSYEWEGNTGIFLKEKSYRLADSCCSSGWGDDQDVPYGARKYRYVYDSLTGEYRHQPYSCCSSYEKDGYDYPDEKHRIRYTYDSLDREYRYQLDIIYRDIDVDKLFKGKKRGEKFKYTLKIVYSFDDGPENTQFLESNVEVLMGKYSTSFMGVVGRLLALITPM